MRGVRFLELAHDLVQRINATSVNQHLVRLDGDELHRDLGNETGEAHAADGGPEKIGVTARRDLKYSTRSYQSEAQHVLAKGAIDVVIFAVHVSGHCARQGDLARAGSHGYEPALRHGDAQQVIKGESRTGGNHPGGGIKVVNVVKATVIKNETTAHLGRVAVTATEAAADDGPLFGKGRLDVVDAAGGASLGSCRGRAAPAREKFCTHP